MTDKKLANHRQLPPIRVPEHELDALKGWAAERGRSMAEEVRLALRLHLAELALGHLADPAGREEWAAEGLDPDVDEREFGRRRDELRAIAYTPPPSLLGALAANMREDDE